MMEYRKNIFLYMFYGIFLLLPWYYQFSGKIQPVDIPILLLATVFFIYLITRHELTNIRLLFNFDVYLIISLLLLYGVGRFIVAYSLKTIASNVFFYQIFNNFYYFLMLSLFSSILIYLYRTYSLREFYQILLNCLLVTTVLPLGILLFFGPDYRINELRMQLAEPTIVRPVLTFNNSNQLGFFALINLSLFFYLNLLIQNEGIKIRKIISLFIINANFIFLLLSVSRAATPAVILYVISYDMIFGFNFVKRNPRLFWSVVVAALFLWFFSISFYHHLLLERTHIVRATQISFMQDLYLRSVEGISYNFQNIYLFLFGNGLGTNAWRESNLEFHNNFAFIFNELGLLGLLLYAFLMITLVVQLFKKGWLYLLPLLCYFGYSNMHYAFRARMNWIFFAMIILVLMSCALKKYKLNDAPVL